MHALMLRRAKEEMDVQVLGTHRKHDGDMQGKTCDPRVQGFMHVLCELTAQAWPGFPSKQHSLRGAMEAGKAAWAQER